MQHPDLAPTASDAHPGCALCALRARSSPWNPRRGFLRAAAAAATAGAALPALAQVDVGNASQMRMLVPADTLEKSAQQQYGQMLAEARSKGALAPEGHPQLVQLRQVAHKLIPFTSPWNERARQWRWEVNLIGSRQVNAFCMPGGKIAFYSGILDQLHLNIDEIAMIMGHEMAHALREHARERVAKTQATSLGLSLGAQLLGLGELGNVAANLGTQLLSLKFSRAADQSRLEAGIPSQTDWRLPWTVCRDLDAVVLPDLVPQLSDPGKGDYGAESGLYDHGSVPCRLCWRAALRLAGGQAGEKRFLIRRRA